MRFESIQVARYGCLADLSTGDSPLPPIVVVLGPNESGKSTVFDFLSTLLYGFRPATRDRHPFTPWTGGNPEGRARLRMDDGTVQEIHRRLLSTGRARLTVDGREEEIGNRPVPGAEDVNRVVFRQVYALTLSELAGLQRESWDLVQDRLVGAMAAPDLRSARVVAAELEAEAAALWRPDRRGRPLARTLKEELRGLNDRQREALERDRMLREKVAGMAAAEAELDALREERARDREHRRVMEHRLNRLLPVRRALKRIEELRREAGSVEELAGLPADPAARLEELRRTVRSAEEGLGGVVAMAGESDEVRARLAEQADRLFSVPWDEIDPDQVAAVSVDDLRDMVNVYQRKREQRRIAEEGLREESLSGLRQAAPSGRWRLGLGLAGLLAGGGTAAVARWFPDLLRPVPAVEASPAIVLRVGLFVAALGLLGMILWLDTVRHRRRYRRAFQDAERGRRTELEGLKDSEGVARRAVVQALNGLPVQTPLLQDPGHDLPAAFERLVDVLADWRGRARVTQQETESIRDRKERAEAEGETARTELAGLEDRLRALGDGEVARGAETARRRREYLDRARQLRGELQREHPALAEIEAEIREADEAGERWESLAGSLSAAAARRDEQTRRAEELQGTIGTLHSEIRHLHEGETADRLAGRIKSLKARIRDARESRDRAFVLARLVREADRRFRDEHQPDLLLRAADHLRYITQGRYDRIELGNPGDESLYLRGPAATEPRPVGESLSQGTREQVYMALRLAIVDHLDADGETLPLFMDETLVNWDAWRRDRAFELLERVAERRQVFLFTCHPAMGAELEDRGAAIIALGTR